MRKPSWCLALLLSAALFPAYAANYAVAVGATVLSKSNCKFNTAAGQTLTFTNTVGGIDPSSATNATASVNLTFTCLGSAATATYSITSGTGLHPSAGVPRMQLGATSQYLPYALNTPLSGSVAKGVATTVTIQGTVTPANFANAGAGTYTDTIVLTLSP